MRCKWILIFVAILLVLLQLVVAYAASTYTIDTDTIEDPELYIDASSLVRWPDGTLWTAYSKTYTTTEEIYIAYSPDDGLNWTKSRVTTVNQDQRQPAIVQSDDWNIHMVWAGKGNGANPTKYALKYKMYDADTGTWGSTAIIYDTTNDIWCPDIAIDSDNDLEVIFMEEVEDKLWHMERPKSGDSWGSWSSASEITSGLTGAAGRETHSVAIDKDDNLGVSYCRSEVFYLRERTDAGSWQSEDEITTLSSSYTDFHSSVMASISGGDTIWRVMIQYRNVSIPAGSVYHYWYASGAWSSDLIYYVNAAGNYPEGGVASAQDHGTGDGDTGDFYCVYKHASGHLKYKKFTLGSGWGSIIGIEISRVYFTAAKQLYPYTAGTDWHWNLPLAELAVIHESTGGAGGWGSGDEDIKYYITGDWGTFPPIVQTDTPTAVTRSTATFNGEILSDGDAECTVRGFQYGFSQTPTWTVPESGTFTEGEYSLPVTDLESDSIYYVRAYAINAQGTGYGEWIGFITAQPSYESEDEGEGENGYAPSLPSEPGGWIRPPKDWGTIGIGEGQIPLTFFVFLLLVGLVVFVGLLTTKYTGSLGILFMVLGVIIGFFCFWPKEGYLDWWVLFPYIFVGWALLVREQPFAWN